MVEARTGWGDGRAGGKGPHRCDLSRITDGNPGIEEGIIRARHVHRELDVAPRQCKADLYVAALAEGVGRRARGGKRLWRRDMRGEWSQGRGGNHVARLKKLHILCSVD